MTKYCLKITVPVDSRLQTVYSILEREVYLKTFSHSFGPDNMHFLVISPSNKKLENIKSNIFGNYTKEDYCYFLIETLDDDKYETIRRFFMKNLVF